MPKRAFIGGLCVATALIAAGPRSAGAGEEEREPAHTVLVASYPAADSTHREEIREIRLRYSTAVQPPLSTITLTGAAGALPVGAIESVPGSQDAEIRASLRTALPSGSYRLDWRTAGPDSHPITGTVTFAVDRPPTADPSNLGAPPLGGGVPRPVPVSSDAATRGGTDRFAPFALLVRSLFFASVLGMFGTALFRLVVVGALSSDPLFADAARRAAAGARTIAWVVAGLGLVMLPARLVQQSTALFDETALARDTLGTVLRTGWGTAWHLELGAAVVFAVGLLGVGGAKDRSAGWWSMLVAALGMAFVPALSGHAVAEPANVRALAVLTDVLHVTAAGAWLGTLTVVLIAGLAVMRTANGDGLRNGLPPLARMVNAFSRMAVVAVGVLVATGVVNAWLRLGSVGALFASDYGRTLLLKVGLVAAAAAAGFYNWRFVRPALARDAAPSRLRTTAGVEVSLGIAVVLITAVLVGTPPR